MNNRGILVNGMPKAGTNLVKSALSLIPGLHNKQKGATFLPKKGFRKKIDDTYIRMHKALGGDTVLYGVDWPREMPKRRMQHILSSLNENQFVQSHIPHSPASTLVIKNSKVRFIIVLRDPRDIVVSHYKYILKTKKHFLHEYYHSLSSDAERLMTSIVGLKPEGKYQFNLLNIRDRYLSMMGWQKDFPGHTLSFEKLIGSKGGGNDDLQYLELEKLLTLIDIDNKEKHIENISRGLFGIGSTFRKGQISSWRTFFSEEHRKVFKDITKDLLFTFGYEKKHNW